MEEKAEKESRYCPEDWNTLSRKDGQRLDTSLLDNNGVAKQPAVDETSLKAVNRQKQQSSGGTSPPSRRYTQIETGDHTSMRPPPNLRYKGVQTNSAGPRPSQSRTLHVSE